MTYQIVSERRKSNPGAIKKPSDTYELLKRYRNEQNYLISVFWDCNHTVAWDYAAAINFVPKKFRTPELCYEALIHHPSSMPGFFNFVGNGFSKNCIDADF